MGACTSSNTIKSDKDKSNSAKETKEKKEKSVGKEGDNSKNAMQPNITEINIKYFEWGEERINEKFETLSEVKVLFDIVNERINKYSEYDLLTPQNVSWQSHIHDRIYNIFPDKTETELTLLYLGLEISSDIHKEYETETTLISTPLLDLGDQMGVAIFNKFTLQVTHNLVANNSLAIFNHWSSYCNGKNIWFICGGEASAKDSSEKYIKDFYAINLFSPTEAEKYPDWNEGRGWHSMIFVPPKFVFIVSGTCQSVELWNIEKKLLTIDSDLNEIRAEATLCCVNSSILYAFCGFAVNESFWNTIEQCNWRESKRKWTYVNYSTTESAWFEQCFYISSYFSEKSLLLFGSSENCKNINLHNIWFDFEDENNPTISFYEGNDEVIKDVCPEKFFHPLSDKTAMMFPLSASSVITYRIDENMKLTKKEYPNILNDLLG